MDLFDPTGTLDVYATMVYLTAPLTPNPTVIMMVRVLGLGSKGKVLSIEY